MQAVSACAIRTAATQGRQRREIALPEAVSPAVVEWSTQDLVADRKIWTRRTVADKYPKSSFCGIDLSPIQPNDVPPKVTFGVDDFEDEWVYQPNHFDYIHMRHTLYSVQDRKRLLKQAYK